MQVKSWSKQYDLLWLLLLCFSLFFVHFAAIPITIMEARNFVTSREMLTENHWLLTTMNNMPRYQKPPLPSWIGSVFANLLGNNLIAYRLPTAIMSTITVIYWYFVSLKVSANQKASFMSAAILASSFYFFTIQREAPTDMYAHGFMVMALYYLFQFFVQENNLWKLSLLSALFLGLSILSKGPVSLYALFLPFIIAFGWVYGFPYIKKQIWPLVISLFIASFIGAFWFIYVRYADPKAFLATAAKETANWGSYNVKPFYYYWSFFTQSGIWTLPALISLIYPYLKNRVSNKKAYKFTLIWTLAAVVLLSLIPEKKARYLFPVLIPLALNTTFYLEYIISRFTTLSSKQEKIPVYIHFGLIALIGIIAPIALWVLLLKGWAIPYLWLILFTISSIICAAFMIITLKKEQLYRSFLLSLIFIATVFCFAFPMATLIFNPTKRAKMDNAQYSTTGKVYSFGVHAPELYWTYKKVVPRLDKDGSNDLWIPDSSSFKVLVPLEVIGGFKKKLEKDYNLKEQFTYDLNYSAQPGKKSYKTMWVSKLFVVSRKTR